MSTALHQAELVADVQNGVGESPVWRSDEQALYWVDIPGKQIYRWSEQAGVTSWLTHEMPACMAAHAQGGWIVGMQSGVFHLHLHDDGSVTQQLLQAVQHPRENMRFNDGRCDRQGRFLAGTMFMNMAESQQEGSIYSYGKDSNLRAIHRNLFTPNGMAFSPDDRTLYLSDSHPKSQTIWAFDYDTEMGAPSNQRVFVDMKSLPGRPDGAAVDQEGCYWICGNDAGLVHRFTPQGKLDQSLSVPVKKPAMCAFGGTDMKTLFVTSIRPDNIDLSVQPLAGGLFALRPGVGGIPESVFQPR
jgi:sugar lactone lactonase YvrE